MNNPQSRSCHQSPRGSISKNRIRVFSSSKYDKARIFKNTDEDIKLGGNKKKQTSLIVSQNTHFMPKNNLFNHSNFTK